MQHTPFSLFSHRQYFTTLRDETRIRRWISRAAGDRYPGRLSQHPRLSRPTGYRLAVCSDRVTLSRLEECELPTLRTHRCLPSGIYFRVRCSSCVRIWRPNIAMNDKKYYLCGNQQHNQQEEYIRLSNVCVYCYCTLDTVSHEDGRGLQGTLFSHLLIISKSKQHNDHLIHLDGTMASF